MILLLMACSARLVEVSGVVSDAHSGKSHPVPQADVFSHDWTTELIDQDTSGPEGFFSVMATRGAPLYLHLQAEGYVDTMIWGSTGQEDLKVERGVVWLQTPEAAAEVETLFAGCPGIGEGATIEGELRANVYGYDVVDGEWPLVAVGRVQVSTEDGTELSTCYLDDEGLAYNPDATETGQTGRFAIFGVPEGRVQVHTEMGSDGQDLSSQDYVGWMSEGSVLPLYPLYVPLPAT